MGGKEERTGNTDTSFCCLTGQFFFIVIKAVVWQFSGEVLNLHVIELNNICNCSLIRGIYLHIFHGIERVETLLAYFSLPC